MFEIGIILFVIKKDNFKNEILRMKFIKEVNKYGIVEVEFVIEVCLEVINWLICVFEKRLFKYFK